MSDTTKIIMGIDPGTNFMGYGVLAIEAGKPRPIILGDIDLHKISDPYRKLAYIFERVSALVAEYNPDEVALESPFFGENVQSMLKLGRAQGVAMAAALSHGKQVFEYAPSRVKQSITGRGSAPKEQVAALLKSMLGVDYNNKRLDATDGMAVALCHHFTSSNPLAGVKTTKRRTSSSSSWESFVAANPNREIKQTKRVNNIKKEQ